MTIAQPAVGKIPDLPIDQFTDEKGYLTDAGKFFFQQLISFLQTNIGNEGLVAPTQTAANITTIAANTVQGGAASATNPYTMQFGTFLYDSTNKSIRATIDNGLGVPTVKTVTLT